MGNMGKYVLTLRSAEDLALRDPNVRVEIIRAKGNVVIGVHKKLRFPPSKRFRLPAFPQESHLYCYVGPSLFRSRYSDFFLLNAGKPYEAPPLFLLRHPKKWTPQFRRWNGLQAGFKRFKNVLNASPDLRARNGPGLGLFVGQNYDDESRPKVVLAKTALLNLFYKLSDMKPAGRSRNWFSYVKRILTIDRERIIAEVQPGMADAVRETRKAAKGYRSSPAKNHRNNFPKAYTVQSDKMFAIKSKEDKGNVQITLAPSTDSNGKSVLLLDADIDENGKHLAHVMDVLEHKFTGGTHPIDIHECIKFADHQADLGYTLAPKT